MKLLRVAVATSLTALTSCGGESNGSSGAAVQIPQPAPRPGPAPSPTPVPIYSQAFDLTQNWSLQGPGAELNISYRYKLDRSGYDYLYSDTEISSNPGAVQVDYNVSSDTFDVYYKGYRSLYENKDLIEVSDGPLRRYQKYDSASKVAHNFVLFRPKDFKYLIMANQVIIDFNEDKHEKNQQFMGGSPTLPADIPSSGEVSYESRLFTSGILDTLNGPFSGQTFLQINYAKGSVRGEFTVVSPAYINGPPQERITFIFSGSLQSGGNEMTGTLTSPDSPYFGRFSGRLYGPRGVEAGIVFVLNHPTRLTTTGRVEARQH